MPRHTYSPFEHIVSEIAPICLGKHKRDCDSLGERKSH